MLLGWGSLIVAASVSYYYAKKDIDERRKTQSKAGSRPTEKLDWRSRIAKDETTATSSALPAAGEGGSSGGAIAGAATATSNATNRGAS